jgi:hypothetical protein
MRLGGPIFDVVTDPDSWIRSLRALGYSAAYCPVNANADDDVIGAYASAAAKADIVMAEIGAWCNPLERDAPLPDWQKSTAPKGNASGTSRCSAPSGRPLRGKTGAPSIQMRRPAT